MIAIMIISISALMHRAVTYYKHEPWEEYLTLIGNIKLNAQRLVELSLVNYTNTQPFNPNILKDNIEKWQSNLTGIYLGYGVSVTCTNHTLKKDWNKTLSYSEAEATFTMDINSIGLFGYKFTAKTSLKIMNASKLSLITVKEPSKPPRYIWTINVTVTDENNNPVTCLRKEHFIISGLNYTSLSVSRLTDEKYGVIYAINCEVPQLSQEIHMIITLYDPRGIKVTSRIDRMLQQTTQTKSPTTTNGNWINPENAYVDGSGWASANKDKDTQQYGGYGFAIPNGSQIVSVRVGLDVWTQDDEKILLYVSDDGGKSWVNSWSSDKLPKAETTFWIDITDWTKWTAENMNNDMIWTKVEHNKVGQTSDIYLDWIRIEVTYIPP
jgi:hypothetical protein